MQIGLCVHTSQTLTASALITDVQSCNLIFINADCFDHSVAILCGAFPALYRHLTVMGIRNTALHFLSSLPWQIKSCPAPQELPTGFPHSGGHRAQGLLKAALWEQEELQTPSCSPFLWLPTAPFLSLEAIKSKYVQKKHISSKSARHLRSVLWNKLTGKEGKHWN